jgi:hypothetical protein
MREEENADSRRREPGSKQEGRKIKITLRITTKIRIGNAKRRD